MDFTKIPDLLDDGEWKESFVARYYYVPLEEPLREDSEKVAIRTRMAELGFEDPASGSAACTLASYLAVCGKGEMEAHFAITQGVEMGRRSEIAVGVLVQRGQEAEIKALHLGGTAVVVMSGSISA
jgi:pre-mRNA-processing factor 19